MICGPGLELLSSIQGFKLIQKWLFWSPQQSPCRTFWLCAFSHWGSRFSCHWTKLLWTNAIIFTVSVVDTSYMWGFDPARLMSWMTTAKYTHAHGVNLEWVWNTRFVEQMLASPSTPKYVIKIIVVNVLSVFKTAFYPSSKRRHFLPAKSTSLTRGRGLLPSPEGEVYFLHCLFHVYFNPFGCFWNFYSFIP